MFANLRVEGQRRWNRQNKSGKRARRNLKELEEIGADDDLCYVCFEEWMYVRERVSLRHTYISNAPLAPALDPW